MSTIHIATKNILEVASSLDGAGKTQAASWLDKKAQSILNLKTAQYVGTQGYGVKQRRCLDNCLRQKRASAKNKSYQDIYFDCIQQYQQHLNTVPGSKPDMAWSKYASVQSKINPQTQVSIQFIRQASSIIQAIQAFDSSSQQHKKLAQAAGILLKQAGLWSDVKGVFTGKGTQYQSGVAEIQGDINFVNQMAGTFKAAVQKGDENAARQSWKAMAQRLNGVRNALKKLQVGATSRSMLQVEKQFISKVYNAAKNLDAVIQSSRTATASVGAQVKVAGPVHQTVGGKHVVNNIDRPAASTAAPITPAPTQTMDLVGKPEDYATPAKPSQPSAAKSPVSITQNKEAVLQSLSAFMSSINEFSSMFNMALKAPAAAQQAAAQVTQQPDDAYAYNQPAKSSGLDMFDNAGSAPSSNPAAGADNAIRIQLAPDEVDYLTNLMKGKVIGNKGKAILQKVISQMSAPTV